MTGNNLNVSAELSGMKIWGMWGLNGAGLRVNIIGFGLNIVYHHTLFPVLAAAQIDSFGENRWRV
jgi:hypothetical protein